MKGIEKRVGQNGTIRYRVKIRLKGFPTMSQTFRTSTHAKKWKKQTEAAIEQGLYLPKMKERGHSVEEAVDKYFKQVLPSRPRNARKVKTHLLWWKSKLGPCPIESIKPAQIAELRDELLDGIVPTKNKRSSATVNRYLASLSHLMSTAEREWEWIASNPVKKVTRPQENPGRTRYLSKEEMERLLKACKESKSQSGLYEIVVLALSTGMRQGEILSLTWKQVDFEQGFILLKETKNDEPRTVPLHGFTVEVLKAKKKRDEVMSDMLLFPSSCDPTKPINLRSAWATALKEADISDFRFHDLRHSCASNLAMNGYSLLDIAKLLGHRDLKSTKRYSHLSNAHTKEMVKQLNEQIFAGQTVNE